MNLFYCHIFKRYVSSIQQYYPEPHISFQIKIVPFSFQEKSLLHLKIFICLLYFSRLPRKGALTQRQIQLIVVKIRPVEKFNGMCQMTLKQHGKEMVVSQETIRQERVEPPVAYGSNKEIQEGPSLTDQAVKRAGRKFVPLRLTKFYERNRFSSSSCISPLVDLGGLTSNLQV